MVSTPTGIWTGATDHINGELVHAANGASMCISHIGHTSFHTPLWQIHLNKVLFVPKAHKNLVSVHHFTKDNNVYLQYRPYHFFVKD
jgi:hypothetical protein